MASPDKATTKSSSTDQAAKAAQAAGAPSVKKSARARRAAQEQARQRQQQMLLTIVAVGVLAVVVIFVVLSLRQNTTTTNVTIPSEANTRYADFVSQKMVGTTADGFQFLGKADAAHTVEEIGSLSCPVCQSYHGSTFVNILDEIKAGRAKFVFIPTTETGDYQVQTVTQGAYCAIQQNKFWEYQEVLYDWQPEYISGTFNPNDTGRLAAAAAQIGMDKDKFSSCINSQDAKDFVDKSNAYANKRGMTATPTIFIDGQLIYPLPSGQPSPDLNQLRGMLEAPAKQ